MCLSPITDSRQAAILSNGKRPQACNFIKKDTLPQMFSREFCEISKNTFFTEYLWKTPSGHSPVCGLYLFCCPKNIPSFFSLNLLGTALL